MDVLPHDGESESESESGKVCLFQTGLFRNGDDLM